MLFSQRKAARMTDLSGVRQKKQLDPTPTTNKQG
jgi:hypothetical protein